MNTLTLYVNRQVIGNDNENKLHGNVQTMTSLEIAELTGKQHFHVMEAIRKMEPAWMKVNGSNFRLVEYRDKKGELRPRISTLYATLIITMVHWNCSPKRKSRCAIPLPSHLRATSNCGCADPDPDPPSPPQR